MLIIPNLITLSRVAATFALWLLFPSYPLTAFLLMLYAIASSTLDGFIARRPRCTNVFGAIIDPLADKILYLGTLWLFREHLTVLVIFIAALPELILILIRLLALAGIIYATIPATTIGKYKMTFHCGILIFLFLAHLVHSPLFWQSGTILVGFGFLLSCASVHSHFINRPTAQ